MVPLFGLYAASACDECPSVVNNGNERCLPTRKSFARCQSLPRFPDDVDLAQGEGHYPLPGPAARERHPVCLPQREDLAAVIGGALHLATDDADALSESAIVGVEA